MCINAIGNCERSAFVDEQKGARAFPQRIPDRRQRLLDELATGDLPIGERTRKVDDSHACQLMPWSALRKSLAPSR